ncbi:hypothetical protein [Streptomyces sp. NPDC018693]
MADAGALELGRLDETAPPIGADAAAPSAAVIVSLVGVRSAATMDKY